MVARLSRSDQIAKNAHLCQLSKFHSYSLILISISILQLVRIYISNDVDPSFLYSLDILEQHYGRVREEEQLLVDFAGFAEKVAWLLNQCCGNCDEKDSHSAIEKSHTEGTIPVQPPRHLSAPPPPFEPAVVKERQCKFRAILNVYGSGPGAGLLRLVESNTFKDLAHLSLQLRAGTDSSIKQVNPLLSLLAHFIYIISNRKFPVFHWIPFSLYVVLSFPSG